MSNRPYAPSQHSSQYMLTTILESIYFLLPAAIATLVPQMVAHWHIWEPLNIPIDAKKLIGNKRIFGANKTVRGYVTGITGALFAGALQHFFYLTRAGKSISIFSYQNIGRVFMLSFLLGFGALAGDSIKSFFKRRLDIAEGESWFFFDQVDFVIGAILCSFFLTILDLNHYLWMVVSYVVIHLLTTSIGHLLGVKKSWV